MNSYADCETYATTHKYNPLYQGWHIGENLILRYHVSGNFRLFRGSAMIREFRPQPVARQLQFAF